MDSLTPPLPHPLPLDFYEKLILDVRDVKARINENLEIYWETLAVLYEGQYADKLDDCHFTHSQILAGFEQEMQRNLRRLISRGEKDAYLNRLLRDLKIDEVRRDSEGEVSKLMKKLQFDKDEMTSLKALTLTDREMIYAPDIIDLVKAVLKAEAQAKLFGEIQTLINQAFEWKHENGVKSFNEENHKVDDRRKLDGNTKSGLNSIEYTFSSDAGFKITQLIIALVHYYKREPITSLNYKEVAEAWGLGSVSTKFYQVYSKIKSDAERTGTSESKRADRSKAKSIEAAIKLLENHPEAKKLAEDELSVFLGRCDS